MGLYDLDGRIYNALVFVFTLGSEERFTKAAISTLGLKGGDRVLDWGCGTGLCLKQIQHVLKEGRIYAAEQSSSMARHAVARARPTDKLDYHFIIGDGVQLSLPEEVDAAVAFYALGTLQPEQFERGVMALWKNTRPQGRVLVVETHMKPATSVYGRVHQAIVRGVLLRLFKDKSSNDLMPTLKRFYKPIEVKFDPGICAISFLGERRDVPLPLTA